MVGVEDSATVAGSGRVSNDKHPSALLCGTKRGSGNSLPLRIVPEDGQLPENASDGGLFSGPDGNKQAWRVLHHDNAGSKYANHSREFPPQTGSFAGESGSAACKRDVLAREPADDDFRTLIPFSRKCPHVAPSRHVRPMFREHPLTVRFVLHLPHHAKPRPLESEIEPADPGEQTADSRFQFPLRKR
jgi:hypothetical protein